MAKRPKKASRNRHPGRSGAIKRVRNSSRRKGGSHG